MKKPKPKKRSRQKRVLVMWLADNRLEFYADHGVDIQIVTARGNVWCYNDIKGLPPKFRALLSDRRFLADRVR